MTQLSKPVSAQKMIAPLQMASGRVVDLANLKAADIHWPDLVEQLVKVPRFNGATPHVVYTAAQHCCLLYDRAKDRYKAHALLSNFHIAYFGEPTWPFLALAANETEDPQGFMEGIAEAKGKITEAIYEAAGLVEEADDDLLLHRLNYINRIDKMLTASERRDLMAKCMVRDHWNLPEPFPVPVKAWGPDKAREQLTLRLTLIGIYTRERV